jgi:hypothetical protein
MVGELKIWMILVFGMVGWMFVLVGMDGLLDGWMVK